MSEIEEKKKVSVEGKDLVTAIAAAAQELGVEPSNVGYKLDLSHFRSESGAMIAKQTVRIIGWVEEGSNAWDVVSAKGSGATVYAEDEDQGPRKRKGRDRDKKREGGRGGRKEAPPKKEPAHDRLEAKKEPRERRKEQRQPASDIPQGTTEASDRAGEWFGTLLERMGIQGRVVATGHDSRVHLDVRAERAGRIIGKRGSTLRAIRHLLKRALVPYGDITLDIDVEDTRPRDPKQDDKPKERKRSGSKGHEKAGYPEEKLRALARRAAEKAIETNKTITINLELSAYDRRIVHLEVAEIDGVTSESEEKDGVKYVQVIPE